MPYQAAIYRDRAPTALRALILLTEFWSLVSYHSTSALRASVPSNGRYSSALRASVTSNDRYSSALRASAPSNSCYSSALRASAPSISNMFRHFFSFSNLFSPFFLGFFLESTFYPKNVYSTLECTFYPRMYILVSLPLYPSEEFSQNER